MNKNAINPYKTAYLRYLREPFMHSYTVIMSIINYSNYSYVSLRISVSKSEELVSICNELRGIIPVTVRFGRFNSDTGYTCEAEE